MKTDVDTVTITVVAVADIVADTVTTNEGSAISFNPITGTNGAEADSFEGSPQITQINGTAITAGSGAVAVTNGSVTLAAGNVLTFTPTAGFNGAVPAFSYTVLSGGVTETANISVTVNAVNSAPTITGMGGTLAYTENGAAAIIDGSVTVGDVNSANFNTGSLTVSFTANGTASDQLSIIANGSGGTQIAISGSSLRYGGSGSGSEIGTFTGGTGSTPLVITFNSNNATSAAIERVIESIRFANTSDDPSTSARTVSRTLVDGDGTANGGNDTATATATVTVAAVNDALVVSAVTVNPTTGQISFSITDPDSTSFNLVNSPSEIAGGSEARHSCLVAIL